MNVPAVTGVPQTVAIQTLKNDGLAVGTISFETNAKSKGLVLSQDPTAGTSVDKDTTVDLVVSNGPNIPVVTVPTVTGLQLTAAIPAHQRAGLELFGQGHHQSQAGRDGDLADAGRRSQGQAERAGGAHRLGHAERGLGAERPRAIARRGGVAVDARRAQRGIPDECVFEPVPERGRLVSRTRPAGSPCSPTRRSTSWCRAAVASRCPA